MGTLAAISDWILPGLIAITLIVAFAKRIDVYEEFIEGAEDGVRLAFQLIPYTISIYIATGLFRESGFLAWLSQLSAPLLDNFGLPVDVLPLVFIRPFSLAAAMGVVSDILETHGPDSYVGTLASVMQGSSETTFYVLTVYLGSVGIRRSHYAAPLCLLGDVAGYIVAIWMTLLFWGR